MKRILREQLVEDVSQGLDSRYVDDLPAIREALNDTADYYRKEGYSVLDFAQDALVKSVQRAIRRTMR